MVYMKGVTHRHFIHSVNQDGSIFSPLDPKSKIDYSLNHVGNYLPISRANLELENNPLYMELVREGVLKL